MRRLKKNPGLMSRAATCKQGRVPPADANDSGNLHRDALRLDDGIPGASALQGLPLSRWNWP